MRVSHYVPSFFSFPSPGFLQLAVQHFLPLHLFLLSLQLLFSFSAFAFNLLSPLLRLCRSLCCACVFVGYCVQLIGGGVLKIIRKGKKKKTHHSTRCSCIVFERLHSLHGEDNHKICTAHKTIITHVTTVKETFFNLENFFSVSV